ncbi:ferredoxin-thioredoxin reductase, variable chain-like [Diospyros lotus]|uniref:ferredoxin-thioredoxin reductase, variable chain-like n=1 Tax=Diospyros lotus TaxID=55363 RepID=UPI002256D556|nr:ferredoxin-thioredoxin reductase, variable chain-like [Diospyros lotus]
MNSPTFFSPAATSSLNHRPNPLLSTPSAHGTSFHRRPPHLVPGGAARRPALPPVRASDSTTPAAASSSGAVAVLADEEEKAAEGKIGARVRVKVPLKVYHVPKVPEMDLCGMEGVLKHYVGVWKGKRISANLPYKVQFITEVEGRGPVKFFAHIKEDEFEYLD